LLACWRASSWTSRISATTKHGKGIGAGIMSTFWPGSTQHLRCGARLAAWILLDFSTEDRKKTRTKYYQVAATWLKEVTVRTCVCLSGVECREESVP
jgi:hypothetical protein